MLTNVEASFFLLFPFSPVRRDDDESTTTIIISSSIIISIRNGVAIGKTAAGARRGVMIRRRGRRQRELGSALLL